MLKRSVLEGKHQLFVRFPYLLTFWPKDKFQSSPSRVAKKQQSYWIEEPEGKV
jgi:hypothetical protein